MRALGNHGGGGDVLPCRLGLGSELHMWRWGSASSIGQGRVLYINPPSMFLIGAMCVYPCQFCPVSSVLQNQSHESPPSGAFLELWQQEKKKAHCCCSFSDGKQAMLLMFHKTDRHHSGQRCASFLGRGRCTCKQGHSPPGMVEEGVKGGNGKSPFSAVKTKDLWGWVTWAYSAPPIHKACWPHGPDDCGAWGEDMVHTWIPLTSWKYPLQSGAGLLEGQGWVWLPLLLSCPATMQATRKPCLPSPYQPIILLCPGWAGFPAPRQADSQASGEGPHGTDGWHCLKPRGLRLQARVGQSTGEQGGGCPSLYSPYHET